MFASYECYCCRALGLMCEYHLILSTPVPLDSVQSGITTGDHDSDPMSFEVLAQTIQSLRDTLFAPKDMYSRHMFNSCEDRAEAVLHGPSANEYHSSGTKLMDTPTDQLTSFPTATWSTEPSCSWVICQWRDEASEICGNVISCESVPKHFRDRHEIKSGDHFRVVTCRWEWCCLNVARKNFVRHIRECHLGHIRR
ncbi:hypothetical protein HD554DRAFT_1565685 [Boletus coccyginus]|nr:hypothetical protein HD554DRAFT_1565685 [Boletus coccyginus]